MLINSNSVYEFLENVRDIKTCSWVHKLWWRIRKIIISKQVPDFRKIFTKIGKDVWKMNRKKKQKIHEKENKKHKIKRKW